MSSKRRVRRKQCEGKVRHAKYTQALMAVKHAHRMGREVHIYACGVCGGYHLGHMPSWVRRYAESA